MIENLSRSSFRIPAEVQSIWKNGLWPIIHPTEEQLDASAVNAIVTLEKEETKLLGPNESYAFTETLPRFFEAGDWRISYWYCVPTSTDFNDMLPGWARSDTLTIEVVD